MLIDDSFLIVEFTEITLLHIFILLGAPYIIFYFFEKFTKFDKFLEKWEGALFIFAVGGSVSIISIVLQEISGISFIYLYITLLIYLIIALWIIGLIYYPTNHKSQIRRWIRIRMNDGNMYVGNILESDSEYIKLGRLDSRKIEKIDSKNKKTFLDAKKILLSKSAITVLFYY
ncbi:hypothetical protein CO038_00670 [Candidatus Pacearchaeota archaeon CG_4_9_14_0_2_um_filter_39_13]|nr:MAG: hypothetical protein CO038_00670 [Candidatus Pacearchaeota archaeon CG_4_9_14_0_2_um_filter_39_13]